MLFPFATLLSSFQTGAYTLTRTPKRGVTMGRLDAASPETSSITAAVFPIGDDEQFEPKGDWNYAGKQIFTTVELNTATETYENDSVNIDSVDYFVLHSEKWQSDGYRALAYAVRE